MASSISAFGYTVPLVVILVFVALVVGLALVVMFWLTTIWSIYRSVQATRRNQVRDDLQNELLERMFDPDAGWHPWVSSLSSVERDVVESLLDEYIRELDGQDVDRLQELGRELGIPERSRRHLGKREEYTRLVALTWLTLLADPDSLHQTEFEPQTPRERAAVARLRWESDDLETAAEGISILLDDATTQFTVFGQDTLYRIATEDPQALFETAGRRYEAWSQSLLVQVLTVCEHVGTNVTEEDISWLTAMLEHDNDVVRESAAKALKNVGWRADIRTGHYLDRLLGDPSPRVRSAVYELLAQWGDEQALSKLTAALESEAHDRARLIGTNALVKHEDELLDRRHSTLGDAWAWSQEHAAFDRAARNKTV